MRLRRAARRGARPLSSGNRAVIDYAPVVARLAALAEGDPEREVCGFVVAGARGDLEVISVRNVAGEGGQPPSGRLGKREAFVVDPAAHLALSRRTREAGGRIAAVFHSHVDGPAWLSPSDLAGAVDGDAPLLPGTDQIVIGLEHGNVQSIRAFAWMDGCYAPVASWTGPLARRVVQGAR
jgi:proteasome lid subunit RPN8/RPN11